MPVLSRLTFVVINEFQLIWASNLSIYIPFSTKLKLEIAAPDFHLG